jgi:outer membrane receptor for ferrienterochelin and colicins
MAQRARPSIKHAVWIVASAALAVAHAEPEPTKDLPGSEVDLFQLEQQIKASIVPSVTKSAQTVEAAPAAVEVITDKQIREWGYGTVVELLRHLVGFYVIDDHILPNVAVRGISGGLFSESGIVKVMVDGHSIAFRSTGGSWLDASLIPISSIARIEVVRGPASALYGADAFLGVLNIVTRTGAQLQGAEVEAGLGVTTINPGQVGANLDVSAGAKKGKFDVLVGARLHAENRSGLELPDSSPTPRLPSYKLDRTANGVDHTSLVGFAKLSYELPRMVLTLSALFSSVERGAEFGPWVQLSRGLDPAGRQHGTKVALYSGLVALSGRTTMLRNATVLFDARLFIGGPTANDRIEVSSDLFYAKRRFGYIGTDLNLEVQTSLPKSVSLVAGVNFIYDRETLLAVSRVALFDLGTVRAGDVLDFQNPLGETKDLLNVGAYAQIAWLPKDGLSLTGGFRYDYHNIYGSQPSGRLALVARLTRGLHLKILYGGAFKAPSPLLLYAMPVQAGDIVGNPLLQPQYVHSFETELSYRPNAYLSVSTGLVYSLLQKAAQFTLDGVNQVARNFGETHSLSWETRLELNYRDYVKAYVNGEYNYTVRDTGYVGYRAALVGSGNVIYPSGIVRLGVLGIPPRAHLRFGVEVSYVGPRQASDANSLANGAPYELPGYWLLDASISTVGLRLLPNRETRLMVTARNLLRTTGPDPGFSGFDLPLAPTTFWFQLHQQL